MSPKKKSDRPPPLRMGNLRPQLRLHRQRFSKHQQPVEPEGPATSIEIPEDQPEHRPASIDPDDDNDEFMDDVGSFQSSFDLDQEDDEQLEQRHRSLSFEDITQPALDEAGATMPENVDQSLMPSGFNEAELKAAANYNDLGFGGDQEDDFEYDSDDLIVPASESTMTPGEMLAPNLPGSRRASELAREDTSSIIQHQTNTFIRMSDFNLALGLMAHFEGTSNRQWIILREILQTHGAPLDFHRMNLPKTLPTLKKEVYKIMPLLNMRVVDISLTADKLPTLSRSNLEQGTTGITEKMHFFDPIDLYKTILSSQLVQKLHLNMAHYVDNPTELYHSRSWASSVRTSSGNYAHLIDADGDCTDPIFPSDWVYFSCNNPNCRCTTYDIYDLDKDDEPSAKDYRRVAHIGRVIGFGKCYKAELPPQVKRGGIVLEIEQAHRSVDVYEMDDDFEDIDLQEDEIVLYLQQRHLIGQSSIVDICPVTVDRLWGDSLEDPSFYVNENKKGKQKQPYPKHGTISMKERRAEDHFIVRRVVRLDGETDWFCHLPPIRAELELQVYGRSYYSERWDRISPSNEGRSLPISLPVTTFIDGFGLFRNTHRTLVGMYQTLAGLNTHDRRRRANTLPILLSPYGSVFEDVLDLLRCFIPLDKGIEVDVKGQPVLMCVFSLCYIGDMLQQNQNAGCLGPTASKFCRFCYVGKKTVVESFEKGDPGIMLDFDTTEHGRYAHTISEMRRFSKTLSSRQRQDFCSQWGLIQEPSNLEKLSPALDPIWTRVPDAAHSEYNGLTFLFHNIFMKAILRPNKLKEYTAVLRSWKFPPGWNRLQSPAYYLGSYTLSDHARWSVIAPGLLNTWLTKDHINVKFWNASVEREELNGMDLVDWLIQAFADLAQSNDLLMGETTDPTDVFQHDAIDHVMGTRHKFQLICQWASWELSSARDQRESRAMSISSTGSEASYFTQVLRQRAQERQGGDEFDIILRNALIRETPPPAAEPETTRRRRGRHTWRDEQAKTTWLTDALRPNIHAGAHLLSFVEDYARLSNIDTLVGEQEHKLFKLLVYSTNLKDCEKTLLSKINIFFTCRMLALGAYDHIHPELTDQVKRIWNNCPNLFNSITSASDQQFLSVNEGDLELEEVIEDENAAATSSYTNITVMGRQTRAKLAARPHAANLNRPLPANAKEMSIQFSGLLREAYATDYGMRNIYTLTRAGVCKWHNKFSFTDQEYHRFTFRLGDFVEYRDHQIGRVDGILVHEYDSHQRIFLLLTKGEISRQKHRLLRIPFIDMTDPIIVAVAAVNATAGKYVIDDKSTDEQQPRPLLVTWSPKIL